MAHIRKNPGIEERLSILSQESQYDLACACSSKNPVEHRHRSKDDKWIYPVILPDNRRTFLLRTLISNICVNDCKYCPLRSNQDFRRCSLKAEEIVRIFFDYYRLRKVSGIFLTSGVFGKPDKTMEEIIKIAALLRRQYFRGYIHLKIIPGASDSAIEQAISLANVVSVNIETAGEKNFSLLGKNKDYIEDIIRPIKLIGKLTSKGSRYGKVRQTTQFVVGASKETDRDIIRYSWGLYKRLGLSRVYFSAYQRGLGESGLPGEQSLLTNDQILTREHRLYQSDFLLRKYGFTEKEIPLGEDGNLALNADPKEIWANNHPDFFPLNINKADKFELLRVPGFGPITVDNILKLRKDGGKLRSMEVLGNIGKRLDKAGEFIKFG